MRASLDRFSTLVLRFIPFLLAFLTPLFFLPFTADPFTLNKFYLITALASLSLVAWCLRSLLRGELSFTTSPSLLPLFILVLAYLASSLWLSPVTHISLFGQSAFFIALFIIFVTTTSSQKNRLVVDSVILGVLLSTTLLSLIAILHYFGLIGKFLSPTGGTLVTLTLTLPILFSAVCLLIVSKQWLKRSFLFASIVLMAAASIINLSLLLPQDGQQTIFLLPFRASWSIAVDIFKAWPTALLGTGPDTYLSIFTRLRPNYLNLHPALWSIRFSESGSFFLTLITTTGLIGSLSFLTAFLRPLLVSFKNRSSHLANPSYIFLTTALATTLLVYLFTPGSLVSLALGVALLIALTVEFKLLEIKDVKDISLSLSTSSSTGPYSFVLPWIITLLSALLLVFYWLYAVPAYSASIQIKEAEAIIGTNPVGAYLKEVSAAKLDPYNSSYPLILSQFFKNAALGLLNKEDATDEDRKNASEYIQRSIDHGKQAASLDPYNVLVWENLGGIYQSFIGVADGAESFAISHLAQAISLDPTNPDLRLRLGTIFFNLGDEDQAIKIISQSLELKQNWDVPYYNLGFIYKNRKDYPRALRYLKAGLPYVAANSENYTKFQEEIAALEKLAPAATPSAQIQK